MERKIIQSLRKWKDGKGRKPLVIRGARQVGKSWILREFGRRSFVNTIHVNFDRDRRVGEFFMPDLDPKRIVRLLSQYYGAPIDPENTLLIFDEIQECPEALGSLKYFCEEAPEYHVAAAGSLLGALLAKPFSYPVGKVELLDMHPLDFEEFLKATDKALYEFYSDIEAQRFIPEAFHERLIEAYRSYLVVGGMPECVESWAESRDPAEVRNIQRELIDLYESDISKHNREVDSGRILQVFRSIPSQLSKPNEKFMYGAVRSGGRARDFESAIEWLVSTGIVNRVFDVSKAEHPLNAYEKQGAFKLFLMDSGLLTYMSNTDINAILLDSAFQYKGPISENFCIQELVCINAGKERGSSAARENGLHYYSHREYEMDLLLQIGERIVPVEIKAGNDSSKASLSWFVKKYAPERALRLSEMNWKNEGRLLNLPLYLAGKSPKILAET